MNSGRMKSVLLCVGLGLAGPALAADDGWYAVGFAGESSASSIDQDALDASVIDAFNQFGFDVVEATSSVDDSDTGFGAAVGYQVSENFAAELAYVDLGSADYRASGTVTDGVTDYPASVDVSATARGPVFSFLGILPIGSRFSAYGRVGIALFKSEGTANVTIDDVSDGTSDSTQRSNGLYGVGGEFSVNNRFSVRLDWTRYAKVGSEDITGESDVDLISLGLRVSFR